MKGNHKGREKRIILQSNTMHKIVGGKGYTKLILQSNTMHNIVGGKGYNKEWILAEQTYEQDCRGY